MNLDPSQILIPALILSHGIVAVSCGFIGYHVASRDSLAIISDLQKRIDELEKTKQITGDDRAITDKYPKATFNPPITTKEFLSFHPGNIITKCASATKRRTKSQKSSA